MSLWRGEPNTTVRGRPFHESTPSRAAGSRHRPVPSSRRSLRCPLMGVTSCMSPRPGVPPRFGCARSTRSRPARSTEPRTRRSRSGPRTADPSRFSHRARSRLVDLGGGRPVVRGDASAIRAAAHGRPTGLSSLHRIDVGLSRLMTDGSLQRVFTDTSSGNPPLDRYPWMLPDGKTSCSSHRNQDPSLRGLYLATLGSISRTRLTDGNWGPVVVDDYLLYLRGPALMSQRLNVRRAPAGRGIPCVGSIAWRELPPAYMAASVSHTGHARLRGTLADERGAHLVLARGRPLGPPVASLADYVISTLAGWKPGGIQPSRSREPTPQTFGSRNLPVVSPHGSRPTR